MLDKIAKIKQSFENDLQSAITATELKRKYLSKNSELYTILSNIKNLPLEERKSIGSQVNELKEYITTIIEQRSDQNITSASYSHIDVTLPGRRHKLGTYHPNTLIAREMNNIFKSLGFSVYTGPEIETDEYVFEKLNLPKHHPARSLQDTLIIEDPEIILRSHTSSVEIRAMENEKLPLRVVVPGRAFRYEDLNQTNHFAFYQYEGLAVGKNITMADLKGTFEIFAKKFWGPETQIRIRAKYYPQVEPGCGLDVLCGFCHGSGCSVCKRRGWIEIAGGGMVHPNALRSVGINPNVYSGFAFGIGFDRTVMQKYKIDDIRKLYDGTIY